MKGSHARAFAWCTIAALLAGCGGAGASSSLVPHPGGTSPASPSMKTVAISLAVPLPPVPAVRLKHPNFVSASTQGALIVVTQGAQVVTDAFDLSSGSGACTTGANGRTCTMTATVPLGNDAFAITTYDQAPQNGSFGAQAHELAVGSTTQNIAASGTTTLQVYLGGLISTIQAQPTYVSYPADGAAHALAFTLAPADYDNNPITAGQNDPYTNPITITLAETGGTGHSTLILNGTSVGTTAQIARSTDTVSLQYDGAGSPGYGATVTFAATGVTAQTLKMSPLYVAYAGTATATIALNGTPSNHAFAISELNAPNATAYTAALAGTCTNVATVSVVTGTGASATFNVQGGTTPSASGCSVAIKDSTNTSLTLPVTNTPVSGTVTIGGVTVTEYSVGAGTSPYGIATGPDGNMWFTEQGAAQVASIDSSGSLVNQYSVPGSALFDIVTGGDGALWMTDQNAEGAQRVTTAGIVTSYPSTGTPEGIATGSDGSLWIADNSSGGLWNLSLGGGFTVLPFSPSGTPSSVAYGTDGGVWFAEGGYIGRWDTNALSVTEVGLTGGMTAWGITQGPDNAIWFSASNGSQAELGRIALGQSMPFSVTATYSLPNGSSTPEGIVGGNDNAIWYTDPVTNAIGRLSLSSHAFTSYALTTGAAAPTNIALGPDGTLWFTEFAVGQIGHVIP